jgi:hypothetical protein
MCAPGSSGRIGRIARSTCPGTYSRPQVPCASESSSFRGDTWPIGHGPLNPPSMRDPRPACAVRKSFRAGTAARTVCAPVAGMSWPRSRPASRSIASSSADPRPLTISASVGWLLRQSPYSKPCACIHSTSARSIACSASSSIG